LKNLPSKIPLIFLAVEGDNRQNIKSLLESKPTPGGKRDFRKIGYGILIKIDNITIYRKSFAMILKIWIRAWESYLSKERPVQSS